MTYIEAHILNRHDYKMIAHQNSDRYDIYYKDVFIQTISNDEWNGKYYYQIMEELDKKRDFLFQLDTILSEDA